MSHRNKELGYTLEVKNSSAKVKVKNNVTRVSHPRHTKTRKKIFELYLNIVQQSFK